MDWSPLRAVIDNNRTFLLTSHVRPDADALGSEIGMAAILHAFGKQVTIINATAPPGNLLFLTPADRTPIQKLGEDITKDNIPECDVSIIVDTSAWSQLGAMADIVQKNGRQRVVIDHHVSSDNLGATEFKDTQSAATGELICDAARSFNITFDEFTANALYAAIATDTGWFRFPSTSPYTMRAAADLMDSGAEPHRIYNLVNEQNSAAKVRLAGRVLQRVTLECENRLAWIFVSKEDLNTTGAVPADSESLVNQCLTIAGAEAAFIAVQQQNGAIKFSLRSRPPHDVAIIAEKFGGGGHKLASGATLSHSLEDAIQLIRSEFVIMLSDTHD